MKITRVVGLCCCWLKFIQVGLNEQKTTVQLSETLPCYLLTPTCLKDRPRRKYRRYPCTPLAAIIKLLKFTIAPLYLVASHITVHFHHVDLWLSILVLHNSVGKWLLGLSPRP